MNTYEKYSRRAEKLVKKLQIKCTPETIKENYGQREIRNFMDKIKREAEYKEISYSEECYIKNILNRVSSITPK